MAEKLQVSIVGLGLLGASAGLALRAFGDKVSVVGHDKTPEVAARAKKLGAVERTDWNLIGAVSNADRVLLALPASEIRPTLEAIARDLKPGCVLVDTAAVKVPVMASAEELLPGEVHFVGGHPILLVEDPSLEGASADLYRKHLFCLTPASKSDAGAVRLAADLVEALGAQPFFLDALEHDGMAAAVEQLPILMAGALTELATDSSSWTDMQKLGGSQFYTSTLIMAEDGQTAAGSLVANREHVLYWLDQLVARLESWRGSLADGDEEALASALQRGLEARDHWMRAQASGNWEEGPPAAELPASGSYLRSLIGFGRPRPAPGENSKKRS